VIANQYRPYMRAYGPDGVESSSPCYAAVPGRLSDDVAGYTATSTQRSLSGSGSGSVLSSGELEEWAAYAGGDEETGAPEVIDLTAEDGSQSGSEASTAVASERSGGCMKRKAEDDEEEEEEEEEEMEVRACKRPC
jgi:hypothetical protein